MRALITWLEQNSFLLTEAAADRLAQNQALRATVRESTAAFYDGLLRTLRHNDPLPLNLILLDWVEARSAPTDEDDRSGLLPVLNTLKGVTWEKVSTASENPDMLIRWLSRLDEAFTAATAYLVKLETEAILKDTHAELDLARLDIDRLNKNKSDFIAVAAHELKTPLTLIEGYADMLRLSESRSSDGRLELMLDGISAGTTRLRDIIADMIDVSLIEMGALDLHLQPMWLHRTMEVLDAEIEKLTRQRNLALRIDHVSFPRQPTYGDPERLYQAIYKVVSNAVKYTPDGGEISIYARELTGFTEIVIKDTGIGIEPEELLHIFEKFASLGDLALHSSGKTKFKGGGAGLGLTIAKGIIDAHGGTIWAESAGHDEQALPGSTFHLMIPMRKAPSDHQMAALFDDETSATSHFNP